MSLDNAFALGVVVAVFLAFVGLGVHRAVSRLLLLVDDHLERVQMKLDAMLSSQEEHNRKIDAVLHKLL